MKVIGNLQRVLSDWTYNTKLDYYVTNGFIQPCQWEQYIEENIG